MLAELELLSHGTVTNWLSTGEGSETGEPPGEKHPPHLFWRDEWDKAKSDEQRLAVFEGASAELNAIRVRVIEKVELESVEELEERIVVVGEGWTVEAVAQSFRCTVSFVRKARLKAGRSIVTGHLPTQALAPEDQREQVKRLNDDGHTQRQIAMITGLSQTTVNRIVRST